MMPQLQHHHAFGRCLTKLFQIESPMSKDKVKFITTFSQGIYQAGGWVGRIDTYLYIWTMVTMSEKLSSLVYDLRIVGRHLIIYIIILDVARTKIINWLILLLLHFITAYHVCMSYDGQFWSACIVNSATMEKFCMHMLWKLNKNGGNCELLIRLEMRQTWMLYKLKREGYIYNSGT